MEMTCLPPPNTSPTTSTTSTTDQLKAPCSSSRKRPLEAEEEDFQPPGASTPNVSCYLSLQQHGRSFHGKVFTEQAGVVEEGGMGGGMSCQLPCDFIILFPFQDPQGSAKRCRLENQAEEEETDEDLAISVSLNDEEESLNLVSPLPTSKVTVYTCI